MEGTRNERVSILVMSYIIGFITAYIAFGVVQLEKDIRFVEVPVSNMASVISAQATVSEVLESQTDTFIALDKGGLILIKDNQRILLSAAETNYSESTMQEGVHYLISDYQLSPDKSQVYFCEVPAADSDSCRPYTYSVNENLIYPVLVDNQRVAFNAKSQEISWSDDNILIVQ